VCPGGLDGGAEHGLVRTAQQFLEGCVDIIDRVIDRVVGRFIDRFIDGASDGTHLCEFRRGGLRVEEREPPRRYTPLPSSRS
jgi:hypothetical protein